MCFYAQPEHAQQVLSEHEPRPADNTLCTYCWHVALLDDSCPVTCRARRRDAHTAQVVVELQHGNDAARVLFDVDGMVDAPHTTPALLAVAAFLERQVQAYFGTERAV